MILWQIVCFKISDPLLLLRNFEMTSLWVQSIIRLIQNLCKFNSEFSLRASPDYAKKKRKFWFNLRIDFTYNIHTVL